MPKASTVFKVEASVALKKECIDSKCVYAHESNFRHWPDWQDLWESTEANLLEDTGPPRRLQQN